MENAGRASRIRAPDRPSNVAVVCPCRVPDSIEFARRPASWLVTRRAHDYTIPSQSIQTHDHGHLFLALTVREDITRPPCCQGVAWWTNRPHGRVPAGRCRRPRLACRFRIHCARRNFGGRSVGGGVAGGIKLHRLPRGHARGRGPAGSAAVSVAWGRRGPADTSVPSCLFECAPQGEARDWNARSPAGP